MGIHPKLPQSPYVISEPATRWRPEDMQSCHNFVGPFVQELRRQVHDFRNENYAGATPTSRSLLQHWFHTPHIIDGKEFRYYFAQREALETLVYLFDIKKIKDKIELLHFDEFGDVSPNMMPEDWARYVVKMATGSGKTKVLSLVIAWSFFHKLYEQESTLARNFLLIAPNIIVLDRLYRDFQGLKIFYNDPVLPENGFGGQNWQDDFHLITHKQNEVYALRKTGNIFLTNIHRVYHSSPPEPSYEDENREEHFLGKKLKGKATASQIRLSDIVRDTDELVVLNDEAHHIHDEKLAWFASIEDINRQLMLRNSKLSLQLDVTATPKHNNGKIFVQTITDYPLVEAIHQNIVKHPVLPDADSRAQLKEYETIKYIERYKDYINLGVVEWREYYLEHKKMGKKAILFIMTDDTRNCDDVAAYLEQNYPELKDRVLVIHTKNNGDFNESAASKKELEKLRKLANNIDCETNDYRAVVSVMMLKEGWDVKNVTTIVGLRPYQAKSNILPEQTLGRGLRLMYHDDINAPPERVSVIGTRTFMDFVEQVKDEGVQLELVSMSINRETPRHSLIIEIEHNNPAKDLNKLDIEIPILTNRLWRDFKKIEQFDIDSIPFTALPYQFFKNAAEPRRIKFEYMIDGEESHESTLDPSSIASYSGVIGFFTEVIRKKLRLFSGKSFQILYSKVQDFVENKLFSNTMDKNGYMTLLNLEKIEVKEKLIDFFVDALNDVMIQEPDKLIAIERNISLVSDVKPFLSKKEEFLVPRKSPFNKIVGDSTFELEFAKVLENSTDVISYAKIYPSIKFRIDYIAHDGNIHDYTPDFFVKLDDQRICIVETKGQEDLDTFHKFARLKQWCEDANRALDRDRFTYLYVTKERFEKQPITSFNQLTILCCNDTLDAARV